MTALPIADRWFERKTIDDSITLCGNHMSSR